MAPRARRSALTTNAIGLARGAPALAAAGLDRVNVSLDTLDRARFARAHPPRPAARRARRPRAAAAAAGLTPVKVNAVLMRGVNDDEAVPLLRFALEHGYELRFIEQMPLDAAARLEPRRAWSPRTRSSRALSAALHPDPGPMPPRGARPRPRRGWPIDGERPATVGIIASVTRPFCGDCDRTRLTADGQVRNCLFARERDRPARRCCAPARPTTRSPTPGVAPCGRSGRATASTTRASCSRRGR